MKHITMLQKICSHDELSNIDTALFKNDKALLNQLIDNKIAMVLDYKYEPPEDVAEFIHQRLQKLSLKPIQLQFEHLEQDFEPNKQSSFIEFMLSNFDKQLKKSKAQLVLLETGSDSYILFMTDNKSAKALGKTKSDFWQFSTLKMPNNAKLYVIYCPNCQNMNVWEMGIDEPAPSEGCCDGCDMVFWDRNGNVIKGINIEIDEIYSPEFD